MGHLGSTHTLAHTLFLTFKHMHTHAHKGALKPSSILPQEGTSSVFSDTYLSLGHDVEVVAVEGEGHVSQDGAAVLDDRHRLVLDAAVRRPVDADLRETEHKQVNDVFAIYISVTGGDGEKKQRRSD